MPAGGSLKFRLNDGVGMQAALAAVLLLQNPLTVEDTPAGQALRYLLRHQDEGGSWGRPPASCKCKVSLNVLPQLSPVSEELERTIASHVNALRDNDVTVRAEARDALVNVGVPAIRSLRKVLDDERGTDAGARCGEILDAIARLNQREDVDLTVSALDAFLQVGYSHQSRSVLDGRDVGEAFRKGLRWVINARDKRGQFGETQGSHALATLLLMDAYEIGRSAFLREPLEKALDIIVKSSPADPGLCGLRGWLAIRGENAGLIADAKSVLKASLSSLGSDAGSAGTFVAAFLSKLLEGKGAEDDLEIEFVRKELNLSKAPVVGALTFAREVAPRVYSRLVRAEMGACIEAKQIVRLGECFSGTWNADDLREGLFLAAVNVRILAVISRVAMSSK